MPRLRVPRPLLLLLAGSALLFTWQLSVSGFANAYYSAAAQAGAMSWKAFLFGSLDPGNGITVDKPPLGLWPMALSVRLFGLNSWSLLLPQALEGVAAVGLLYACVHRTTRQVGRSVLAGTVFALTPVTVLIFRYNNPDAALTLVLLAAAYASLRALESEHPTRWMILAGGMSGFGFLAKMLEAGLALPAFAVLHLVFGQGSHIRRVGRVTAASLTALLAGGWWVAIVQFWPAADRPFVGGSPTNSFLQLTFGYNGVARITGAGQGSAALLLWGVWIVVASGIFAAMAGIFHSYYTVILAPAIAALVGIGAWLVWENRSLLAVRRAALVAVVATGSLSGALVLAVDRTAWALAALALALTAWAATLLSRRLGEPVPGRLTASVTMAGTLLVPSLSAMSTIALPHTGPNPMAGPGHGVSSAQLSVWTNAQQTNGFRPVSPAVVDRVRNGSHRYRWAAAAMGARSAAAYQLVLREPVLAIGGYKGDDPAPTLQQFVRLARSGQVHWFIPGGVGGDSATQITDWARAHFLPTVVDGINLYEVGGPYWNDRPTGGQQ